MTQELTGRSSVPQSSEGSKDTETIQKVFDKYNTTIDQCLNEWQTHVSIGV